MAMLTSEGRVHTELQQGSWSFGNVVFLYLYSTLSWYLPKTIFQARDKIRNLDRLSQERFLKIKHLSKRKQQLLPLVS